MNSFLIPTIVLLASLGIGLTMALLRMRSSSSKDEERDLRLRIEDLENRRDELYTRLRGERDAELEPEEVSRLEDAAARTLRDLDEAQSALAVITGESVPKGAKKSAKGGATTGGAPTTNPRAETSGGFIQKHPMLVGTVFGGTMVGLFALLVFWAQTDATPGERPPPEPGGLQTDGSMAADHPQSMDNVPPQVQQQISQLQAAINANPDDFQSRKQLAVLYLQSQMLVPAFQNAQELLKQQPTDPDGLYISGVVRLAMGEAQTSIGLLDQVLGQFPDHFLAMVYKGIAYQRLGQRDEALKSWEAALVSVGGRHPELEQMILQLRGATPMAPAPAAGEMPAGHPPVDSSTPAPTPAATPSGSGGGDYRVRVELPPGVSPPANAVLLVSLHTGSGPPAASKRVSSPSFPAEVTLSASDSMMGTPLPSTGTIQIRLDEDGDPSTEGASELWSRGPMPGGRTMTFVLWDVR